MGPCLCGDTYCPSCGSPGLAKLEAAEESLVERLHAERLTADEYAIVLAVGIEAVRQARAAVSLALQEQAEP